MKRSLMILTLVHSGVQKKKQSLWASLYLVKRSHLVRVPNTTRHKSEIQVFSVSCYFIFLNKFIRSSAFGQKPFLKLGGEILTISCPHYDYGQEPELITFRVVSAFLKRLLNKNAS